MSYLEDNRKLISQTDSRAQGAGKGSPGSVFGVESHLAIVSRPLITMETVVTCCGVHLEGSSSGEDADENDDITGCRIWAMMA